jgi:hypothetical protein
MATYKQKLVNRVIDELKSDIEHGDETVLNELLHIIPVKNLIESLSEEEWRYWKELEKVEKIRNKNK